GGDYKRAATAAEIETMKALVDRGMQDGAIGLSSGLEYDPGFYSKTDELVALGAVVAKYGGYYMSHVRNENEGAFAAWREAIEIGRRNHIPVEISHIKLGVKPVWGRAAEGLKILEDARREGVKVMADWYPYTYWQSSMYVLIETRDFESRAAWERGLNDIGGAGNVLITSYRPDASLNGKTLAEIAEARGKDAVTTAIEMMREAGPGTGVIATSMSEDDLTTFVKSPLVLVCSDGSLTGRHPRGYGTFPRVLARYVRDLEAIALPDAVAKMTGRSAAADRRRLPARRRDDRAGGGRRAAPRRNSRVDVRNLERRAQPQRVREIQRRATHDAVGPRASSPLGARRRRTDARQRKGISLRRDARRPRDSSLRDRRGVYPTAPSRPRSCTRADRTAHRTCRRGRLRSRAAVLG